jgi:hypothetical protein
LRYLAACVRVTSEAVSRVDRRMLLVAVGDGSAE